jgi:hypothetical protein
MTGYVTGDLIDPDGADELVATQSNPGQWQQGLLSLDSTCMALA